MRKFKFDKALLWAFIGFITIIVVSVWSVKYLQRTADEMTGRIDVIAENVVDENWELAYKEQQELVKEWAETREAWLIMLEETQISAIESLLIRVETLLRLQEKEDVLVELADLSMTIGEIPIKEKAYWNHIL